MGLLEGLQAFGAYSQQAAAAGAASYNSRISKENAMVERQNSALVSQAGATQAAEASMRGKETLGSFKANKGAGGIEVETDSSRDTAASIAGLSQLDALTIRSNAVKQAYGHEVAAEQQTGQAGLYKAEEQNDTTAAYIDAGSTYLSSSENTAENFAKYAMAGGFGG